MLENQVERPGQNFFQRGCSIPILAYMHENERRASPYAAQSTGSWTAVELLLDITYRGD